MNQQTEQILQQLAQKMGTTTQYLWSVFLKQAPIDSTITIFQWGIVAVVGYILYRLHLRFDRKPQQQINDRYKKSLYEKYDDGLIVVMFCALIIWFILVVACFFSITDVVNGYLNPEYWALKQILDTLKK